MNNNTIGRSHRSSRRTNVTTNATASSSTMMRGLAVSALTAMIINTGNIDTATAFTSTFNHHRYIANAVNGNGNGSAATATATTMKANGIRRMEQSVLNMAATTIDITGYGTTGTIDYAVDSDDKIRLAGDNDNINDNAAQDVKVGVLMLNLGGPEKTEDVEGFLYNLFADPDIIRLPAPLAPLQKTIAYLISKRRAPKSIAAYESIGGGSPILKYSNEQAKGIQQKILDKYSLDVSTYVGMRYWYPFTEEALEEIQKDGIEALVIVPLYPQFSISTSGSSLRVLQEEFARNSHLWGNRGKSAGSLAPSFTHTVIPSWYDRPGYIKAMADIIQKELDSFTQDDIDEQLDSNPIEKHILFSAHGVPQSYIEAGDPYQDQIIKCVQGIAKLLPSEQEGVKVHLSYQSRVGPIEWLRPYTDDVLPQLGADGVKNLVVVPISFVSEHIETLEEIDIEYRELAEESGIKNWRRAAALNTDETFIEDMADMIVEALNMPSQSVTEACVANNVGLVDVEGDFKGDISSAGVGGVGYNDDVQREADDRFFSMMATIAVVVAGVIQVLSGKPLEFGGM